MPGPAWIPYSFAVVMVAVSLYCVCRLVAARQWRRKNHADVNISHVLMGFAMAGMLVPAHNPISPGVGEVIFAVLASWFLAKSGSFVLRNGPAGRDEDGFHHLSHYAIHLVMSGAMVYMYAVGTPTSGSPGAGMLMMSGQPGTPRAYTTVSLLFVVVLFASAIWQLDSITRFAPANLRALSLASSAPGLRAPAGVGPLHASPAQILEKTESAPTGAIASGDDGQLLAPRLEMACHIAMCVTMGYMLIIML